jgi:flagella basal body P-ring formation protein FlgA
MIRRLAMLALVLLVPQFAYAAAPSDSLRVVVPAHDIARGAMINDSDLTFAELQNASAYPGVVTEPSDLSGMTARRMLRAGQAVRGQDVRKPVVVTKGETVTMMFAATGIKLTSMGRAMSEGGEGDTITVQNLASFRQVSATVTGPGQVSVGSLGDNDNTLANAGR